MPAIAPEEKIAEVDDEVGGVVELAVDVVVSEGYPWPGLNMRVEFLA
jgi:hypothetical protein